MLLSMSEMIKRLQRFVKAEPKLLFTDEKGSERVLADPELRISVDEHGIHFLVLMQGAVPVWRTDLDGPDQNPVTAVDFGHNFWELTMRDGSKISMQPYRLRIPKCHR